MDRTLLWSLWVWLELEDRGALVMVNDPVDRRSARPATRLTSCIAPGGTAYAALTSSADAMARLYTINLTNGAATAVGPIGGGVSEVRSLTILPEPPPPPPPPPPPSPPADVNAPIVLVSAVRTARLGGLSRSRLTIAFSCNEACTAAATVRIGRRALARGSASLGEPNVGRLRLRTTAAQRRTIQRPRGSRARRQARLTLTFTDPAGNRRTVTRRLTLRR